MSINKLTIIQVTAAYKPAYIYGGPTMSVGKLCEALAEQGIRNKEKQKIKEGEEQAIDENLIEIEVFTTTANGRTELPVIPNQSIIVDKVKVTYFKRLTKDHTHFSPALLWNLRKAIKSTAINNNLIIHIHAWWNLVSVFSCLVGKWYNVPVLLSPRGMLTSYTTHNRNSLLKSIIHNLLGKHLLNYCDIHATSEQEKLDILRIVNPKSITIIPNLVKLNNEQKTSNKQQEELTIQLFKAEEQENTIYKLIFLSRIEEKKGLELLFDALSSLTIDWTLTIAGSGEDKYVESLKQKAESLKLNNRIYWLGQVSNKDKFNLLAEHNLMVLSSYNENFANVVIESLSVGTPVLISENVGLADYVLEKNLGWISSQHKQSILEALYLSYSDHYKRKQIREKAPAQINTDFTDEVLIEKYTRLYKTIAKAKI